MPYLHCLLATFGWFVQVLLYRTKFEMQWSFRSRESNIQNFCVLLQNLQKRQERLCSQISLQIAMCSPKRDCSTIKLQTGPIPTGLECRAGRMIGESTKYVWK